MGLDVRSEPNIKGTIKRAFEHRWGKILFFAAAENAGKREKERFPTHYSDRVISVRGTFANGTFNSNYEKQLRVLFEKRGMVSLLQKTGITGITAKGNRVIIFPWLLFNVTEREDWERLPHDMLNDWIQTMYHATKGL